MGVAPTGVHRPSPTSGRRVTARGQILGLAPSDMEFVGSLHRAGLPDAEMLLDDPARVKWRGGGAHHQEAAWPALRGAPDRSALPASGPVQQVEEDVTADDLERVPEQFAELRDIARGPAPGVHGTRDEQR